MRTLSPCGISCGSEKSLFVLQICNKMGELHCSGRLLDFNVSSSNANAEPQAPLVLEEHTFQHVPVHGPEGSLDAIFQLLDSVDSSLVHTFLYMSPKEKVAWGQVG